ncbi:uncharacterized protein Dwil_GK12887 [Drosophila willistoni]|uniref:Aminopeptidase n=1 Tax=Drosophila willistoni TaxID=7260 RepID=B4NJ07_DROWI|nr:aminopeptidase N [Drosophila willistoni]EDW84909.1 uncharacterized protein Dwil_GK12887 [Drosophila willistoni]
MAKWLLNSCLLLLLGAVSLQAGLIIPHTDVEQIETKGYQVITPRVDDNSPDNYRLPNNSIPVSYNVELWTNVHEGDTNFNGTVKIDIQIVEASVNITLHARQTSNFVATIIDRDNATATEINLEVDASDTTREFLVLSAEGLTFDPNTNWTLTIKYTGLLRLDMGGFYMSSYTENNTVHYLATTQFESTNARHAFPCYDEPSKRATFTITIKHDPSYTAISNMPVNETTSSSGITGFQTTPIMSTYLVAFIVSDFESTGGELNGLPQRVFSRKGKQDQQEWALWSGLVVESSLASYFGVPFALPKLDQAGIPDFSAGAMENWGLATYREQYMWWTKEESTINLKTNIANIIGHEYTHMWFGDLVSVKWWTYLWQKEGFATLFSYESNDIAFPEWDTYQIFHVADYHSALMNDAGENAVPMTHYVQTPNEISNRYNTYSYAKPASVLYTFKNAWTDKVFRLGVHKYLDQHKFTSCDEWDLFASFQEAADELNFALPASVADIFSSWSHQAGYPLLTVERNYDSGSFTVKQQRYVEDKNATNDKTWYVPINYVTASQSDYRDTSASNYLLNTAELTINAQIDSSDFLLLNKQSAYYQRVLYDQQNYDLIAQALLETPYKFHPRNRAQLIAETYRFAATGRLSQSTFLQIVAYLKNEDQYAPWSFANSIFPTYDQYLRGDDQYEHFRLYVVELVEDIFDKIGVHESTGEHYLNKYLRVVLINLACQVGTPACYEQTHQKLKEFQQQGIAIEPTIRTQVYCGGLRQAEDSTFNQVLSDLFASTVSTDRSLFISSLGCSQTAEQIERFISSSIDTSNSLTNAERTTLLNSAYSRGEVGITESLKFLESNWEAYANVYPESTGKPLDAALRGIATYVVSETQKTRLENLVEEVKAHGPAYVNDDLSEIITARIDANFAWLNEHRDSVINWLVSYRTSGSSALTTSLTTFMAAALTLLLCKVF